MNRIETAPCSAESYRHRRVPPVRLQRLENGSFMCAGPRSIAGAGADPLAALRDYEQAVTEFADVEARIGKERGDA